MNIAILTTARSDFGPLKRVIRRAADHFHVSLLIAGSHFLPSRGRTIGEIKEEFEDTPNVALVSFDAMVDGNSASDHITTLSVTQSMASRWFDSNVCDLLLFLGDRWELWGVTLPAFLHGIPLAHVSGGEVTEGVIDDAVRHSHSKLSALHFVATDAYAANLSLMGEEDWRITVSGECGLDQIYDLEVSTPQEVKARFSIDLAKDILLVTYHPATLDCAASVEAQIHSLLLALESFSDCQLVFTAPGMEQGSQIVLNAIQEFVAKHASARFVEHLGSRNYLAVLRAAKVVIGNSSSGLVEAASFGVPAVNIGARQKNRIAADSVQHVGYSSSEIKSAIERALANDYQHFSRICPNPYDPFRDGKNSDRIVDVLVNALTLLPRQHLLMKKFDNRTYAESWNSLLSRGDH